MTDDGLVFLTLLFLFAIIFVVIKNIIDNNRLNKLEQAREAQEKEERDEWLAFLEKTLKYHVNEHLLTLSRKRKQLIITDDYGIEDKSKWIKELKYFFDKLILPDVRNFINNHQSHNYLGESEAFELLAENLEIHLERMAEDKAEDFDKNMTPYEYEHYCASLLQDQGWKARATQASGDQGVDVVAERNGIKVAIQCKMYKQPVGNKAVQEIRTGVEFIDADFGAVVATNGFTRSAKELANKTGVILLHHSELSEFSPQKG